MWHQRHLKRHFALFHVLEIRHDWGPWKMRKPPWLAAVEAVCRISQMCPALRSASLCKTGLRKLLQLGLQRDCCDLWLLGQKELEIKMVQTVYEVTFDGNSDRGSVPTWEYHVWHIFVTLLNRWTCSKPPDIICILGSYTWLRKCKWSTTTFFLNRFMVSSFKPVL